MKLLSYGNWKQRIPFDNIIYKDVKRYSLRLNSYEREIMDKQINYYRSHFSLLQVMKHFKTLKTNIAKDMFIRMVLKRADKILYIPRTLQSYFKKKISDEFRDNKSFFDILLDKGLNQKTNNELIDIVKSVFGLYYKPVMKQLNKYRKKEVLKVVQKTLKPEAIENTARDLIHNLQNDLCLSAIYGRSSIRRNVPISIVDDYGYGEWISKQVTFNTNRFFIYSNNNKITNVQLEHMVYFNVYPGYGYFYNTVVDETKNLSFDNGATYLINGWAMYAMCKSKNSAYANSLLSEGSTICHHLLNKNTEKGLERAYVYLLGKYPKAKAIDYLLDYTQYPGHYLSYVLGCFATEMCINEGFAHNPVDYLKTLSEINCGDFFAIYHPKIQKKIAKHNITAKVSNKFQK